MCIALAALFLGIDFSLVALIVFSIASAVFAPLKRVSEHVIDLQTMESIGRSTSDFYATMILRDFSQWIWRMLGGGLFLLSVYL